jgi:hypothetical protein
MKNTLLNIIEDWVISNKKIFWKYEVSSYFPTYKINVANLPVPAIEDIKIMSSNRMFNNTPMISSAQKTQLCEVIKKACAKAGELKSSSINIKIDYVKGAVIAAVI